MSAAAAALGVLELLKSLVDHYGEGTSIKEIISDLETQPAIISAVKARRAKVDQELHERFDKSEAP